jgi:hypothetical protein
MVVALGSMIGITLLFSLGVGLSTLFTEFTRLGMPPIGAMISVMVIAGAAAAGLAHLTSTLIRKAIPVKPKVVQPLEKLLADVGMIVVDTATSFIQGFNENKRQSPHVEIKNGKSHLAKIIPLRRREYRND